MKHRIAVFLGLPRYVRFLWFFAAFEAVSIGLRAAGS
jgi:hypothetical protein